MLFLNLCIFLIYLFANYYEFYNFLILNSLHTKFQQHTRHISSEHFILYKIKKGLWIFGGTCRKFYFIFIQPDFEMNQLLF